MSIDSSTEQPAATASRRSAGTRSPATSRTTSSGHELGGVDLDYAVVPADRDHGREQLTELCGRMLGAFLLDVGEHPVDQDHDDDRDGQLRHTGQVGQHGGAPQQDGEEVSQFGQQACRQPGTVPVSGSLFAPN